LILLAFLCGQRRHVQDGSKRTPEKEDENMGKKATQFVADLRDNVDAWYDGRIDYDAFTARQRETWEAIRGAGPAVEERVLRALAGRPDAAGESRRPDPLKRKEETAMGSLCKRTQTRTEACARGACARRKSPGEKYRANKRDVLALLDLIAGCVEHHPRHVFEKATWANVGDIAHLRDRLMEIAVGFGLGPDGDEQAARRRIEEALCAEDEHVAEALIDAV
jgi:hypothetical protein